MTFLVAAVAVLVAAAVADPSVDVVRFFGFEVPPLCAWRAWTGIPCPGCGLTRSFAFLMDGDVVTAVRMNPLGPIVWIVVAAQIPYRALRAWRAGYDGTVEIAP